MKKILTLLLCLLILGAAGATAESAMDILTAEPWKHNSGTLLTLNPDGTGVMHTTQDLEFTGTWELRDSLVVFTYEFYGTHTVELIFEEVDGDWRLHAEGSETGFLPQTRADEVRAAANEGLTPYKIPLGTPITLPFVTLTFDRLEVGDMVGLEGAGHYHVSAADGYALVAFHGTLENVSTAEFKATQVRAEMAIDGYTYSGLGKLDAPQGSDMASPLAVCEYWIYASVPSALAESFTSCVATFAINENFESTPAFLADGEYVFQIKAEPADVDAVRNQVQLTEEDVADRWYSAEADALMEIVPGKAQLTVFQGDNTRRASTSSIRLNGENVNLSGLGSFVYASEDDADALTCVESDYFPAGSVFHRAQNAIPAEQLAGEWIAQDDMSTLTFGDTRVDYVIYRSKRSKTYGDRDYFLVDDFIYVDQPEVNRLNIEVADGEYRLSNDSWTFIKKGGALAVAQEAEMIPVEMGQPAETDLMTFTLTGFTYAQRVDGGTLKPAEHGAMLGVGEGQVWAVVDFNISSPTGAEITGDQWDLTLEYKDGITYLSRDNGGNKFYTEGGGVNTRPEAAPFRSTSLIEGRAAMKVDDKMKDDKTSSLKLTVRIPTSSGQDARFVYTLVGAQEDTQGDAPSATTEYTDRETVQAVQQALNDAGYDCGTPDGLAGKKTRAAITAYQQDHGLTVTGTATYELLDALGIQE